MRLKDWRVKVIASATEALTIKVLVNKSLVAEVLTIEALMAEALTIEVEGWACQSDRQWDRKHALRQSLYAIRA